MSAATISAIATAAVSIITAVGALLHSMQTRNQVNPRQSAIKGPNTGTVSWPEQQP